jgi:hypothetical protein
LTRRPTIQTESFLLPWFLQPDAGIAHLPFEAKARVNNIEDSRPYLKENTTHHDYRHQFLNRVQGNNPCLQWELYTTHKYKMHSY